MSDSELTVIGEWPELSGQTLDTVLCQEFWCDGKLEEPANAVNLSVAGEWYRLIINAGTIFLRRGERLSPLPNQPDGMIQYKVVDLGENEGLSGSTITGFEKRALPAGAEVAITLDSGRKLCFVNQDEVTSYQLS